MAVYSINSEVPQPALKAAIERVYPDRHYHFSETVTFVRASATAQSVAISLGVKTLDVTGNVVGQFAQTAVVQLAPSYWGWSKSAGWEWLKSAFEAGD